MYHLIIVIMSIGLMGLTSMSLIQYVSPLEQQSEAWELRLEQGLHDLKGGYNDYVSVYGTAPLYLDDMTPDYVFLPPAPKSMTWSFSSGGNDGRYFCLSGLLNPVAYKAVVELVNVMSPQAYFINNTCGATTNAIPTMETASAGGSYAVTYWVKPY